VRAPDFAQTADFGPHFPAADNVLGHPLPHLNLGDRLMLRALALAARRQIVVVHGLQHVRAAADPFILAANHNTCCESFLVPAVLCLHRGGRLMHFLADWNFRLIPGVGYIYSRAQVVTVTRKPAKPRILNILKPLYRGLVPPFERARGHLTAGRSIGIFPEGQINRDPDHLLRGRRGAARLSLETGVPVVPMGIRFPGLEPGHRIRDSAAMELRIGAPLIPPTPEHEPASLEAVSNWHAAIMLEIAHLSGKRWQPPSKEANHGRS
jgi:1-acyl-sn-glycerol-3-phosphate acyltransferase